MTKPTVLIFLGLELSTLSPDDLSKLARAERARRLAIESEGHVAPLFTNDDLGDKTRPFTEGIGRSVAPRVRPERDLVRERRFWRKEKAKHDRDMRTIERRIEGLESRLRELRSLRARRQPARLTAQRESLEEALDAAKREHRRRELRFRERARKAGAFPGWLR